VILDRHGKPYAPAALTRRADNWSNPYTGIGTSQDKTRAGTFLPVWRIFDQELTNLYNGSWLSAKIVDKSPIEMFRRGYDLSCADESVNDSDASDLHEYAVEELRLDDECLKAMKFGGLYGGFLLFLGVDDGGAPDEPLDETRIRSFSFVNGIDRRFCYVLNYYSNPLSPKYGQPEHYLVTNGVATLDMGRRGLSKLSPKALKNKGFQVGVIHESRVIRWEGVATDQITQQTLAGWTWSVLQRVYDEMQKFEHGFDSASYLLSDASQAVFAIEGLISLISAGNLDAIQKRIQMMEQTRSVLHGILVDSKTERFERTATPFGGIADLLDKMMLKLAAAVDLPVTEIFGRAASGLNAAAGSDSETRKWYDRIASRQKTELAPRLRRIYRLLSLSADCPVKIPETDKDGRPFRWQIDFAPLFSPTDEEQAKCDLAVAQRDQIYLAEGVVTPEEVALSRADLYPSMDVEARENAVEEGVSHDPYENEEPEVEAPGTNGEIPSPSVPVPVPSEPAGTPGTTPAMPQATADPAAAPLAKTTKATKATKATKKTAAKKTAKPKGGA
jgi:uncharacterized protein